MVGYPLDAPGYHFYNPTTPRITTSVHVVFLENVLGFSPYLTLGFVISDRSETEGNHGSEPQSHPLDLVPFDADGALDLDPRDAAEAPPPHELDRPHRMRSHPVRYGELVAHLSDHPHVLVATRFDHEEGKATKDLVAQPDMATLTSSPQHLPAGATSRAIALLSARDCVEPTSYRAALTRAQAPDWHIAMLQKYDSLMDNGTWELVDLPAKRTVVNIMWIYKTKSDTEGNVSCFEARFVAKG
jgi:hypothetical protein